LPALLPRPFLSYFPSENFSEWNRQQRKWAICYISRGEAKEKRQPGACVAAVHRFTCCCCCFEKGKSLGEHIQSYPAYRNICFVHRLFFPFILVFHLFLLDLVEPRAKSICGLLVIEPYLVFTCFLPAAQGKFFFKETILSGCLDSLICISLFTFTAL